jgi:hypothetical protein
METENELMQMRVLKESQTAMLRAELKSYPNDAFLMATSNLAEIGQEMWHFIKDETKRRGLIGNAISLESKDGVRAFICCVTLKELGTYKVAKLLMNRTYEKVLGLFGNEQAKGVGLMLSPRSGRFVIECENGCGQYMARFFVESLVKNLGRNGFTVQELKTKV